MIRKKLFVMGIIASYLLVGCGKNDAQLKAGEQDTNTLLVDKKGKVQVAVVESFEKPYYNETELENFLKDITKDYNDRAGADAVEMTSIHVENDIASTVFSYKDMEDYVKLNEAEANLMSFEQAKDLIPDTLLSPDGGEISKSEILNDSASSKYNVLILNEEYDVIVEGVVKYYTNAVFMSNESVHTQPQETSVILFK